MKISVVGAGYLGTTHAICMAALGHEVVVVDVDSAKINDLNTGKVPFFEPGLSELFTSVREQNRLIFTTELGAIADAEINFLCIGTPQSSVGLAADLTGLRQHLAMCYPRLSQVPLS